MLTEKLKVLKVKLKNWNKDSFGRVEVTKKEALRRMEDWDGLEVTRPLSIRERELKLEAMEEFKH